MRKKRLECVAVSDESFCYNGNFLNENKRERLTAIYIHVISIMKDREIIQSFLESVLLLFLLNSLLASIWYQSQQPHDTKSKSERSILMATPSNSIDEVSSSSLEIAVASQVAIANINPAGLTISLKLSRENFLLWKTQLLPVLAAYDLVTLLDQDPPMVSYVDKDGRICPNPAYKTWFKNDQVVLAIISSSLSASVLPILVGKTTAREAWQAINRNFAGKSKSRIMELQTRLHNLRKDTLSVDDYVQLVRSIGDELRVRFSKTLPENRKPNRTDTDGAKKIANPKFRFGFGFHFR